MSAGAAGVEKLRLKFPGTDGLLFADLTLQVEPGQKVLLLGPSGCGKSTLLQVLTGLIPGSIDIPLKYERIRIPESWGYVFQDPDTQFCMPFVDEELAFVLENLQVPRERMRGMMSGLLERVGLQLGDLHTPIAALSQGMKQRLAIASVMALQPEALFLDEPTALLDPEGTKMVWETIKSIGQGKTVVIVEHKIDEVIDFVDRVVIFDAAGAIIADGAAGAVFREHKRLLAEYGIWYPGVWQDYAGSERFRTLRASGEAAAAADSGTPPQGAGSGAAAAPLLELRDFAGYRGGKIARIEAAEARAAAGEWIAVVGENGAGKSTLLQALMQLIATSGGYRLEGREVRRFDDVAGALGFVFQNPEFQFVTNSVHDEIAHTLRMEQGRSDNAAAAQLDAEVRGQLARFGLDGTETRHPYQLSLGQKRRLSVAATAVRGRQAMLLDEPTFGQDAKNTFALLEKLEEWRQLGTTLIMVTHDMDIVRHFATRVWVVRQGKLIRDTEPAVFLQERAASGEVRPDAALCI
ncbi:ABC transporter ATP-binding protein [Paenibacillus hamazuiensis]|uniref:ABC transporter ATP-binding protein n=1 Tax=Paenibacillus hamazuiensis TaxID=2936508 RepID=UPI00200FEF7C|nr:ABC transporter ATP-binding protein [Paenibacillus hamazuiensis]